MNPLIIRIAGGTGSGKSTLTRPIADAFAPDCRTPCHANDWTPREDLVF